jgi:hypothetical protein
MTTPRTIRLACSQCDTDQADGITKAKAVETGWKEIVKDDLVLTHLDNDFRWWTHIGTCGDCATLEEIANRPPLFDHATSKGLE